MPYFILALVKKNLEMQPDDTSLDPTLTSFGEEADAHIDSLLGNGTPMTTIPTAVRHASSNYAAGRFLSRVKEDVRGNDLIKMAEEEIKRYKNGPGRVTVWG